MIFMEKYVGPDATVVPSEDGAFGFRGLYTRTNNYLRTMKDIMPEMLSAWGDKDFVKYNSLKGVFFRAFGDLITDMEQLETCDNLARHESTHLASVKEFLFENVFKVLYGYFAGDVEADEQLVKFVNAGLERVGGALVEDGFVDEQPANADLLASEKSTVRNQVFGSIADRFGGAVRDVLSDREDAAILIGGEYGFLNKDAGVRDMVNALRRHLGKEPRRGTDGPHVEQKSQKGCAIIFIDLDKFKLNNDLCSHAAGDQTLLAVAAIIKRKLRRTDIKMRAGGEELVLYLDDVTMLEALKIGDGLREEIATVGMTGDYSPKFLSLYNEALVATRRALRLPDYASASVGVSFTPYGEVPERYDDLKGFVEDEMKLADGAMYGAKTNGRNGVVFIDRNGQLQKIVSITSGSEGISVRSVPIERIDE